MNNEYLYERACLVDLAERYAVDGHLLGKRIAINHRGVCITIVFPSVVQGNVGPILCVPGLMRKYGIDETGWGKINGYKKLDEPNTIDAWLSCVLVLCRTNNPVLLFESSVIEGLAKKVIHALQVIKPEAIRLPSDDVPNVLCQVKNSASIKKDGRPIIDICIASMIDDTEGCLTLDDIKNGLKNAGKTVAASYELLDNARVNLLRQDTRASVLNCATVIEIVLKRIVSDYCELNHWASELKNYVLKQADGYSKLVGLCKALGVSFTGIPNVEESVVKIRNRVIHGGYTPSYIEANTAYQHTRETLSILGIAMFE